MWRPNRIGNYRNVTLAGRLASQDIRTAITRRTGIRLDNIKIGHTLSGQAKKERNEGRIIISTSSIAARSGIAVALIIAEKPDVNQLIQTDINFVTHRTSSNTTADISYTAHLGLIQSEETDDTLYYSNKHILLPLITNDHGTSRHEVSGQTTNTYIIRYDDFVLRTAANIGIGLIFVAFNHHTSALATGETTVDMAIQRYETDIVTHDPSR